MTSSCRGAFRYRATSWIVLLLVFAAALLTVSDGGRFWQDDCHVEATACADEGADPCQALSSVSTPRADLAVAVLSLACVVPACASAEAPAAPPRFAPSPRPHRPRCTVVSRVRSPRAPPLVLAA